MSAAWRVTYSRVLAGPAGAVVPLLILLPLTLSYSTYGRLVDAVGGSTLQKILVVVAVGVAILAVGIRIPPLPVWMMAACVSVGYIIGIVTAARGTDGFDSEMLFGAAGLIYPWLVFFVDWRRLSPFWRTLPIAFIAPFTIVIAWLLQVLGAIDLTIVREEYTGAARLAGGLPPAFLAGLGLLGVAGSMLVWSLHRPIGFYLAVINVATVALTGTRMATAAAGLIFAGMLVVGVIKRYPHWIAALVVSAAGGAGGAVLVLPMFLKRVQGAAGDGGALNGSGRDQAWTYFWERLLERPVTGYGPGSGPLLSAQSNNPVVHDFFISPHNSYLTLGIDLGVPLALVFLGSLIWLMVRIWIKGDGNARWLMLITAVACLIYAGFDNLLTAAQSAVMFGLVLALLWSGTDTFPAPRAEDAHDSPGGLAAGEDDGDSRVDVHADGSASAESPRRAYRTQLAERETPGE